MKITMLPLRNVSRANERVMFLRGDFVIYGFGRLGSVRH